MSKISEQIEQSDPIIVSWSWKSLRNHPIPVLKAWVKRFVDEGDKVIVCAKESKVLFECPDHITEFHVIRLCEIIEENGFAKTIFPTE